jgi:hypothetical protein
MSSVQPSHCIVIPVGNPDIGAVIGKLGRELAHNSPDEDGAVFTAQFRDSEGKLIAEPDAGTIEKNPDRIPVDLVFGHKSSVTRSALGDRAVEQTSHPNVGSVEGDARGRISRGIIADEHAVARPQFAHEKTQLTTSPNICSIETDHNRVLRNRKATLEAAITCQ